MEKPVLQSPELLRRLLRAKDRMDARPEQDWTIDQLAAVSAVSPAHFAREFKKAFGLPPHRYLLSRRIERATALLRSTELPIIEIALQTGWNSIGTFGRIFKDITGDSPGDHRARSSEQLSPQVPLRQQLPECVARASDRPNLNTAVLEKRRRQAAGKLDDETN